MVCECFRVVRNSEGVEGPQRVGRASEGVKTASEGVVKASELIVWPLKGVVRSGSEGFRV